MSLLSSSNPSLLFVKYPTIKTISLSPLPSYPKITKLPLLSSTRLSCTSPSSSNDPSDPSSSSSSTPKPPNRNDDVTDNKPSAFVDDWGEKSGPEPEPATRFPDPRGEDDEWGDVGNGSTASDVSVGGGEDERLLELKRCLVDTVYGTDLGFRASSEVRAETLELVQQLEATNPTPAPTEATELLDGNWVLVYTAFSELLPLLAAGSIPTVKVDKITQRIDASNLTIENATTLSGPLATLSFSASANFEVRSPCRIQVQFKEGSFNPPEIKSSIDLPENVDIFGQTISLSPVQQSLNPLQDAVAGIARTISGQPPLKIPIPGERTKSWLLITYLDKDLRISRGDGGLFVLVKEGSPLLYQ